MESPSCSLAMAVTSSGTISACRFMRPTAQPGKPAFGFSLERNDDDRNVVDAAAFVSVFDELFSGALRIRLRLKSSSNFRLGDHTCEAIRAEEQNIAREKRDLFDIHFDFGLCSQEPEQNAL